MWWPAIVVLAVLCRIACAQDVAVENNAYQGLVVAIKNDLIGQLCDEYVVSIKDLFTNGSALLHSATGNKLFFGEVTIVVPEGWTCQDAIGTSDISWDQAHLRVGPSHPIFNRNPWTQQPRGCGEPGDFMYFPETFLLEDSTIGPKGNVLVHEWAKYRWGVFEEYGHRADVVYPSAFRSYEANQTIRHNYCTDGDVAGDYYLCDGENLDSCYFIPNVDQTTGVTSSLLATPFLGSVVNFCTSETHVTDAPTKHNLLCDKRSTWDVIREHPDITATSPASFVPPTFIVRSMKPVTTGNKLVFLLDITKPMQEVLDTWEYLRDAVRQFILVEAAEGLQVGLVTFTDVATTASSLTTLDSQSNRETLAGKVPDAATEESPNKNVAGGITKAKEVLGGEGIVILVTENTKEHTGEDLAAAADGTPVWPLLYPHELGVSYGIYQVLADANSGVSVITIENKIVDIGIGSSQSINNRVALTRHLLEIQDATLEDNSLKQIVDDTCSGSPCQMTLEVSMNTNYQQNFYIEIYFSDIDSTNIKISVQDPSSGNPINVPVSQQTSTAYAGTGLQAGTYIVDVTRRTNAQPVKASLLATEQTASGGYSIKLWSSIDLQHLEYTSQSAPTLFAMVGNGESYVVYANVTATVMYSGQVTAELVFRDDGTGADVTGNDGVYSAYLIGPSQTGAVSVQVAANDNSGAAKLVTITRRAAPVEVSDIGSSCCGSQITIPNELPAADQFALTQDEIGALTGTIPANFPPGRVTDLRSSLNSSGVTLTFTAPGDELDQGTAARYDVNFRRDDNNTITTHQSNATQWAGTLVSFTVPLPECDVLYHITVTAIGTQSQSQAGKASNEVREIQSCTEPPSTDPPGSPPPLSGGAIAGIVIGVILFLIIVAIIIYLVMNRDNLDDVWLWQMLTCRCLRKRKNDDIYNPPAPRSKSSGNDVIRNNNTSSSGPVRSIDDLYSKPDLTAKKKKKMDEDDGDGGFGERKRRVNNAVPMNNFADSASTASTPQPYYSRPDASINQVGLPPFSGEPNYGQPQDYGVAYDNNPNQYDMTQYNQQYDQYGYSSQADGYDNAGYSTDRYDRVPAPRKTKSNTQV